MTARALLLACICVHVCVVLDVGLSVLASTLFVLRSCGWQGMQNANMCFGVVLCASNSSMSAGTSAGPTVIAWSAW